MTEDGIFHLIGDPVEWLLVTRHDLDIKIVDGSGQPVERCHKCRGLIRAAEPACPRCAILEERVAPQGVVATEVSA